MKILCPLRRMPSIATSAINRVLKNRYQAFSQGDYELEARRLERWEAKKTDKRFYFKLPSLIASGIQPISNSRKTPDHGDRRRISTHR
jgi:hypothetical protein